MGAAELGRNRPSWGRAHRVEDWLAELGQKLDSIEGSGDTDGLAVGVLNADDGGLAEGPTGGQSDVRGQHEDEFELGSGLEGGFRVEENARGAEVAGDG